MGVGVCVAGFFLLLGLLCLLLPETVALWGTYADSLNRERSRKILALFPRTTRGVR